MLAFAIATGMSQGVLPLIGYNFSTRNYKRMKSALKVDFILSFTVSLIGTVFLFTCAGPIVKAFIDDGETVRYGQLFQKIICITGPCISVTMLTITAFQSVGEKARPTVLSLMRKGGLGYSFHVPFKRSVRGNRHCVGDADFRFVCNDRGAYLVCAVLEKAVVTGIESLC